MATKDPFPPAPAGQKRYKIHLEPKENEEDFKVELMAGRMEMVDGANFHRLMGNIEEKDLEGWGYTYYQVTLGPKGSVASTRMMPLGEAAEKREKFLHLYMENPVRYNSKLPIVVYMPEDGILRYKIWGVAQGGREGLEAKAEVVFSIGRRGWLPSCYLFFFGTITFFNYYYLMLWFRYIYIFDVLRFFFVGLSGSFPFSDAMNLYPSPLCRAADIMACSVVWIEEPEAQTKETEVIVMMCLDMKIDAPPHTRRRKREEKIYENMKLKKRRNTEETKFFTIHTNSQDESVQDEPTRHTTPLETSIAPFDLKTTH
eukprot:gene964-561_t